MIEEVSYNLLDILAFSAGIDIHNLHLNPGDEVADRPAGTNNLLEGRM